MSDWTVAIAFDVVSWLVQESETWMPYYFSGRDENDARLMRLARSAALPIPYSVLL